MLIATNRCVLRLDESADDVEFKPVYEGPGVRRVCQGGGMVLVALADGTLELISQGGPRQVKTGIDEPVESVLLMLADPLEVLVGTEGAGLYFVTDDGINRVESFDQLPCRSGWHTPWGGPPAVRSLAATEEGYVYADIHVGSVMRSPDGGRTWRSAGSEVNEDVHQVATCPSAPSRVYANSARGVYISEDWGESWQHRAEDLGDRYGRAIAVMPDDGDLILATVSDGPHGENVHGQLYRTEDAGQTWQHVADGFPDSTRENINTYRVAFTADGKAWAAVENRLYLGLDRATKWREVWSVDDEIVVVSP